MIAGPSMQDEAGEFLHHVVALYNTGVRTRDFSAFVALLTDDAVLDFEGTSEIRPFQGKAAIAQHFDDDPPDDGIRVKRWKETGNEIAAEFGWLDIPEGHGCLYIERRETQIARIVVALGGPRCRFR
jgi:hypothetical protein